MITRIVRAAFPAVCLLAAVSGEAAAEPNKGRFFDQSLASQLVQSMTQRRILQSDDAAASGCQSREFMQAAVVAPPAVTRHSGYETKSWQEDWMLNRCGQNVAYRVFYNEVGAGGVTFSVAPLDAAGAPVVVAAVSQPAELSLQKPYMRGDDVRAVQVALADAGMSIKPDGVFGPNTQKAVKAFQEKKGLKPTGIVGRETREALGLI